MARLPRLRPDPGKRRSRRLIFRGDDAWEQLVLTYAGQASVGLIGESVVGLAVEIENDRVVLHARVLEHEAETMSSLERIRSELEDDLRYFVTPTPDVLLETAVSANWSDWDGFWQMSIYRAKWSTQED